jgi:hypothetical protein
MGGSSWCDGITIVYIMEEKGKGRGRGLLLYEKSRRRVHLLYGL